MKFGQPDEINPRVAAFISFVILDSVLNNYAFVLFEEPAKNRTFAWSCSLEFP